MLMIRLKRTGRTNDPSFKIVVGEKIYSPKSGKHLAYLGSYNPKTKAFVVDKDAVKHWMLMGAQLSATINNLFITKGVLTGKKIDKNPRNPEKKEEPKEEPAPTPEAAVPEVTPEPAPVVE